MRPLIGVLVLLCGSCAAHDDVRPDDMSAAAHRDAAARDDALAAQHEARYDPSARETELAKLPGSEGAWVPVSGNATRVELEQAELHRAHARAHVDAAKALEGFEDVECRSIPRGERGACPLLGPVARVETIPVGVRITLAHPELREAVIARMRCHLAFARARAFDVPSCPLYVRGLDIQPGQTPGAIELRGATPAAVDEIRKRAPEELSIPGTPSASR
ncbi:MAG: hypothetical protein JST54_11405 [Deltaproteobacteria bacterium]|nr:hypothetical protein [Deltaproteobacteria bacterium]